MCTSICVSGVSADAVKPWNGTLFGFRGRRVRVVGEGSERNRDGFGQLLKTFYELGAAGAAQAVKEPAGVFQRFGELLDGVARGDHRGLRLDLDGGALREDAVKVDPPNTDATADAGGGQFAVVYPLSGLPDYVEQRDARSCPSTTGDCGEFG